MSSLPPLSPPPLPKPRPSPTMWDRCFSLTTLVLLALGAWMLLRGLSCSVAYKGFM